MQNNFWLGEKTSEKEFYPTNLYLFKPNKCPVFIYTGYF